MRVGTFLKARLEHTRNNRKSRAQIEALQQKKFRRIVRHANGHSPYYRDLIKSLGLNVDTCQPSDFPPLTKPEFMANFDRIVTDPRITIAAIEAFLLRSHDPTEKFLGEYTLIHTSGTSGTVGHFLYSPTEWARALAIGMRSIPFSWRRRRIAYYGLTGGHFGGATTTSESRGGMAKLRFDAKPIDINEPLDQTIDKLNEFQPNVIAGYPTSVRRLAGAQERGDLRISPDLLIVGGEPITAEDRTLLERVFAAPICNQYGTSEHTTTGYGLSGDDGIYLFEDELIFEIDGERALTTNLFRFTQPMIRYQMDDLLEPIDDPHPRYPFTKIKELQGRRKPDLTFTNRHGEDGILSGHLFVEFFVPNLERLELRVFDKLSCVLRVKLREGLSEADYAEAMARIEHRLTEIFEAHEMGNVSRRIDEVERFVGWKPRLIILPDMADTPPVLVKNAIKADA